MSNASIISVDDICARGIVRDSDVKALRRMVYDKNGLAAADIEGLLRINRGTRMQDPAWAPFFVEAATDFVVNELPPQGYVTGENANWLMQRIGPAGRVDNAAELEVLLTVLDRARWVPESLVSFALRQVKLAVIGADGPLRAGQRAVAGEITSDEVALVRRVLYAFGGDGNAAITRSEAQMLIEIEEATAGRPQAPEWQELFVKAIASVVMAASGYRVPSREEALRQENWLLSRGELTIASFLSRVLTVYQTQSAQERALARLERQRIEIITSEEVTESSAAWLAERLGGDRVLTANERVLLAFIRRESSDIAPALQPLLDRAVRAA